MKMRNIAWVVGAVALTGLLTGCMDIASQYTVKPTDLRTQILPGNPYSNAIGMGEMSDKTGHSIFNDDAIGKGGVHLSMRESLKSVGYLAPDGAAPSYVVDAALLESSHTGGLMIWSTWHVKVAMSITLREASSNAEVYKKTLRSEYEAKSKASSPEAKNHAVRLIVQEFLDDITSAVYGK